MSAQNTSTGPDKPWRWPWQWFHLVTQSPIIALEMKLNSQGQSHASCQNAFINMRKFSIEQGGHMGDIFFHHWQRLLSYRPWSICYSGSAPVYYWIHADSSALMILFSSDKEISDQRVGFNFSILESCHSQITCCWCCQQCFPTTCH